MNEKRKMYSINYKKLNNEKSMVKNYLNKIQKT